MDVVSLGIMGATIGGITTAGSINGNFGFYKIMSAIFRESASRNDDSEINIKNSQISASET